MKTADDFFFELTAEVYRYRNNNPNMRLGQAAANYVRLRNDGMEVWDAVVPVNSDGLDPFYNSSLTSPFLRAVAVELEKRQRPPEPEPEPLPAVLYGQVVRIQRKTFPAIRYDGSNGTFIDIFTGGCYTVWEEDGYPMKVGDWAVAEDDGYKVISERKFREKWEVQQ